MSGPIDLFLVAGQSNAQGHGDSALAPTTTPGLAFEHTVGRELRQLADPVHNALTGSAWPAFTNAFTAQTGRPVCISAAAVGATRLLDTDTPGEWGPDGTLTATSITRGLEALADLTADGWTPTLRGVLWCQGEYDAMLYPSATLEADYEAALVDLHQRYRAGMSDPALRFYVVRTGRNAAGDNNGWRAVRAAQDAACTVTAGMVMAYTGTLYFPEQGRMVDNLHYNQDGLNVMGAATASGVLTDLNPPTPPRAAPRTSITAQRLLRAL